MPALPFVLDVEVVTEAPLMVGGRVTVEGPYRLRLSSSLGVMPEGYLDLVNTVCTSFGWYDDITASLIASALDDAVVWRTHLGWRPWAKHGFFFGGGYGYAGLGGGLAPEDVATAMYGTDTELSEDVLLSVQAGVHMIDVTAGWEWTIKKHFLIKAELGGAFTLASTSRVALEVDTGRDRESAAVDAATDATAALLDTTIETYIHTPTIGLGVGWRF